jgi:hypothetical protein
LVFNENVKIAAAPLFEDICAFVIDDALIEPDALVQFAMKTKSAFKSSNADTFPGVELRMADSFTAKFEDFFRRHLRRFFDARRTLAAHTRLSLATTKPDELRPVQWLPHRDALHTSREHTTIAATLFLFDDVSLGGIGFYVPKQPLGDTYRLFDDCNRLSRSHLLETRKLQPGYCTESNDYFELIQSIPAKKNRLIVYDGALFCSAMITDANKLNAEPHTGRLTMSAAIVCRRHSDGRADRWNA